MKTVQKPLSWIRPSEVNSRKHTEQQIEELARSVDKFDVIRPIVTDEDGRILAGHGLYLALQKMGREKADVLIVTGLSEADKKKLILADNKIFSLGIDDYYGIEQMLQELAGEGDFEVPGYSADVLEELYGIRSVEGSAVAQTPPMNAIQGDTGFVPLEPKEPTARMEQARDEAVAKAGRFIICPNCGERIDLE